jgi:hypothetical protein
VGASGGGKTYRRRRPINFYGVVVVVCVLGVASVALARYSYQHPAQAATPTPPVVGQKWYAASAISTCGVTQAPLAPNPASQGAGATALGSGVILVSPATSAQTGANATLQLFVNGYHGLVVTKDKLVMPPQPNTVKTPTWTTGMTCPKGTPDAGKKGHVEIAKWKNLSSKVASTATDPAAVAFSPNMLVTIGFVPDGAVPPRPPSSAVNAMFAATTTTTTTTSTTIANSTTSTTTKH